MLKFLTKKRPDNSSTDVPKTTNVVEEETIFGKKEQQTNPKKHMKVDLNVLPADPGKRPSMEFYHVSQRDEIRRAYLIKGPCQPQEHSFPQRYIGGHARDIESGKGQNQEVGIKRPCDTRWGSHFASLLNIKIIYSSICEVLSDIKEDRSNDQDLRGEASRVFRSLKSFDFVFSLHLMIDILGVTDRLNTTLQRKDQDIVNAMNQVRLSKNRLQEIRNEGWEPLLEKVTSFCDKHDVEMVDMKDPYYDGTSRRRGSKVSNLHHYHVDVFYAVIDMQLTELNYRFNEVTSSLLLSMACLCPNESFKAFDLEKLMEMAKFYPKEFPTEYDLQRLELELQEYIKDVCVDEEFKHLKGIGHLAKKMVETKRSIIYPKVYLLLKLALILPVATSTVERAFSAMKLIKTDLRNRMSDRFMNDCLVSYIERDILDGISNEDLMTKFQSLKPRRVVL